jgi:hypothetical protein
VFSEAVRRGLILRQDDDLSTLDTTWELDLSGMLFPVARAACRFMFHRLVDRYRSTLASSFFSTTNVDMKDHVKELKDLLLITKAGRMREYICGILRDELSPSVYCVVPKMAQGTLQVKRQVLVNYLQGQT